jgi:RsbT co-antagonist protein rsbRD N-terminal domain
MRKGVMFKPVEAVKGAKKNGGAGHIESVADILERELQSLIADWLARVDNQPDLMRILMKAEDRTGHLPHLLHDLIARLRLDAGTKAPISEAAARHGELRHRQGYTVAMAVEESRLLQVTIFSTLHNNVKSLEFSKLLPDVVTIADEVDAQLKVSRCCASWPRMPPSWPTENNAALGGCAMWTL